MAGVRSKPREAGKYQGWFTDYKGKRKFSIGTRSKAATLRIARRRASRASVAGVSSGATCAATRFRNFGPSTHPPGRSGARSRGTSSRGC